MGKTLPTVGIGYKVGKLTVTQTTHVRKAGYMVWVCQCACGNEVLLDTRCLQRKTVSDCGCITKVKPGQIDLSGQRFGRLVCIEPTKERRFNGSTVWKCICDCGNECMAAGKQLTSGYKKSCGCWGHPPLKDYIGKRFHQLTVIDYAGKAGGMHRWKCRCDCGNETIVGQTLLQNGKTKSCGCLQSSIIMENLKLCEGTSVAILEATKRKPISSNQSGYTGVYQNKKTGKWVAQITFKRKTYYLGSYEKIEDAVKARRRGEEMHDDFLEWYYSSRKDLSGNRERNQIQTEAEKQYGCNKVHPMERKVQIP